MTIAQDTRQSRLEASREPIEGLAIVKALEHPNRPSKRILKQTLSFS